MTILAKIELEKEAAALPLRLPIQDVYCSGTARQVVGRLASGTVKAGDHVLLSPSGASSVVRSLVPSGVASAGENVALELADDVFAARGDVISHTESPPKLTRVFDADLFWFAPHTLTAGMTLRMRVGRSGADVQVQAVRAGFDDESVGPERPQSIVRFGFGTATLRADHSLALDDFIALPATGRLVLLVGHEVAGIGVADTTSYPDLRRNATITQRNLVPIRHTLTSGDRRARFGHAGAVVWLTGLSGAGKSTLAIARHGTGMAPVPERIRRIRFGRR